MKKKPCTCPLCAKGDYNPADYMVDLSELDRERPCGVSGLMRVKNEARWVAQSIDSCIDALDELIICYQESTDETAEILELKRRQYPDKIRTFFYAPPVYAHNLSKEDFQYAVGLPEDSIHLLSNYYNYTLTKASYRYAVKIDADQIYFSARLKLLCDAYRNESKQKITLGENMAEWCVKIFPILLYHRFKPFTWRLIDFLPFQKTILKQYQSYLLKQVCQTKCMIILSGINLSKRNGKWGIPAFRENLGLQLAFNGGGDHWVFEISDQTYFYPAYQTYDRKEVTEKNIYNGFYKTRRIIEYFHYKNVLPLYGGFYWYHMKFVDCKEVEGHFIDQKVELTDFLKMSLRDLVKNKILDIRKYHFKYHLFSFVCDKNIPFPEEIIKEK
mgnify:CR=1 FL=1